jgi:hypothetical protein
VRLVLGSAHGVVSAHSALEGAMDGAHTVVGAHGALSAMDSVHCVVSAYHAVGAHVVEFSTVLLSANHAC